MAEFADWSPTALAVAEREETRRTVRTAIEQLPDTYRTVLLLRDIEGMNTAEAAAALDVTEAVVKTRLHRARTELEKIAKEASQ